MAEEQSSQSPQAAQGQMMPNGAQVYSQPVEGATPQIVYVTRPMEPPKQPISDDALKKHGESKKKYPFLNLSEGEYVISAVKRHPIGVLQIWAVVMILWLLIFGAAYALAGGMLGSGESPLIQPSVIAIPAFLLAGLALLFGFIATSIYEANKFFLTNESVIQYIQTGIFSRRQQTVSLSNIEDASYNQHGLIPTIFNYGLIRLSTEGDETTYRFNYASRPEHQISILNNAVEAFKNGRPVVTD